MQWALEMLIIPLPMPQETWVKDEKDAHHIHKRNSPTRE